MTPRAGPLVLEDVRAMRAAMPTRQRLADPAVARAAGAMLALRWCAWKTAAGQRVAPVSKLSKPEQESVGYASTSCP